MGVVFRLQRQIDEPFWRKGNWVLIAIYGLMFALFAKLYGGLKVGYLKRIDVFYSLTLALLCTNVVEYLEITPDQQMVPERMAYDRDDRNTAGADHYLDIWFKVYLFRTLPRTPASGHLR